MKEKNIFEYLDQNKNDSLSKIKGYELQDIIILINNYYIELRKKLELKDNVTFGFELEFEYALRREIDRELVKKFLTDEWKTKCDLSLNIGGEISTPILKDKIETWEEIKEVCLIVNKYARIGKKAGGHIHVGTQVLGTEIDSWKNFIKLWLTYENVILRFAYGEFLTSRPYLKKYAQPIAPLIEKKYETIMNTNDLQIILLCLAEERRQAVNFQNVGDDKFAEKNTIEFRCPNGTINPIIWQNTLNFFVKLLSYARSMSYNSDLVEQRYHLNQKKYDQLELYDEVYLEQALELCDMIFDNNLDKINFLKQYLKKYPLFEDYEYPKTYKLTK